MAGGGGGGGGGSSSQGTGSDGSAGTSSGGGGGGRGGTGGTGTYGGDGGDGGNGDAGQLVTVTIAVEPGDTLTIVVGAAGAGGSGGGLNGGDATAGGAGRVILTYSAQPVDPMKPDDPPIDLESGPVIDVVGRQAIIRIDDPIDLSNAFDLVYVRPEQNPLQNIDKRLVASFRRRIVAAGLSPEQYRQFLSTTFGTRIIAPERAAVLVDHIGAELPTYDARLLVEVMDEKGEWPRDRMWTGLGPLMFEGEMYSGIGSILNIEAVNISPDGTSSQATVRMNATDPLIRAAALRDVKDPLIKMRWIYSADGGHNWTTAPLSAVGRLNGAGLNGAEFLLTLAIGPQIAIDPSRIFQWTHEDTLRRNPAWGGFEFVRQLEGGVIVDWKPPEG